MNDFIDIARLIGFCLANGFIATYLYYLNRNTFKEINELREELNGKIKLMYSELQEIERAVSVLNKKSFDKSIQAKLLENNKV